MGGKLDAKWLDPYIITGVTKYRNRELHCCSTSKLMKQCVPSLQLKHYISPTNVKVNTIAVDVFYRQYCLS